MTKGSIGRYYSERDTPTCDEDVYMRQCARYISNRIHPAIAEILAYEDATGTGAGPGRVIAVRREQLKPEWTAA